SVRRRSACWSSSVRRNNSSSRYFRSVQSSFIGLILPLSRRIGADYSGKPADSFLTRNPCTTLFPRRKFPPSLSLLVRAAIPIQDYLGGAGQAGRWNGSRAVKAQQLFPVSLLTAQHFGDEALRLLVPAQVRSAYSHFTDDPLLVLHQSVEQ